MILKLEFKQFTMLFGAALLGMLVSCGKSEDNKKSNTAGLSAGFASNCASCHGSAGTGGSQKSLKDFAGGKDAFSTAVRSGRPGMGAFTESSYSNADLDADFNYLKAP
jgi:mono/diheme cytochrome c family protein